MFIIVFMAWLVILYHAGVFDWIGPRVFITREEFNNRVDNEFTD